MTAAEFQQKYNRPPTNAALQPPAQAQSQSLGDTVGNAAQGVTNFIGAKGIADEFGATIAQAFAKPSEKARVDFPSFQDVAGSAIQTGANLIPGVEEGGLLAKTAAGLGTGYAMDVGSKLQNNEENPLSPGVATAVGGLIPGAGAVAKPATAIVGRLLKGLGSGLSGVSSKTIEDIVNNPQVAQRASQQLAKQGNSGVLENNARTIVNGISKVRQEARKSYGDALGALKEEDINPTTFRQNIQPVLDKVGSVLDPKTNTRTLNNVEFSEQKNLDKAGKLIDEITKTPLDGLSLRNLSNKIDDAKYKTATSDERLSFNAFLNDLESGVKSAVNSSTDKLGEMNKKYSSDMDIAKTMEDTFGKVKYKNLPEVVKASNKMEGLFAQKGLTPDVVDNFLGRIGVSPKDFRTTEAVRQMGNKADTANSMGLSLGEVARETTSAIVTPEMVKNVAVATGMAKESIEPFLKGLKTPARNAVLQALLQAQGNSQ